MPAPYPGNLVSGSRFPSLSRAATARSIAIGIDEFACQRSGSRTELHRHALPVNRDGHLVHRLVNNDDALQGIKDGRSAGPIWEDLAQPVWSPPAIFSDRAVDELVDKLAVALLDSLQHVVHPLKAGGHLGPHRPGEVFSARLRLELGNERDQGSHVAVGQIVITDDAFAAPSASAGLRIVHGHQVYGVEWRIGGRSLARPAPARSDRDYLVARSPARLDNSSPRSDSRRAQNRTEGGTPWPTRFAP